MRYSHCVLGERGSYTINCVFEYILFVDLSLSFFLPFFLQFWRTLLNRDNFVVADSRGAISNFRAEEATSKVSCDRLFFPLLYHSSCLDRVLAHVG